MLLGYQPQPGAEAASLLKAGAIANRRHHRARGDRADPRYAAQALTAVVLLRQSFDLGRYGCNALVQAVPVLCQVDDKANYPWREHSSVRAQDFGQLLAQGYCALPHRDAALDEEAADLIDHTCPLANEARAHTMQRQQVHLLRRLDRHKVHGWALHGFRDRLGIAVVVLVSFEERLDVLRRHQPHVVAERRQPPADVMRTSARLHTDKAAGNIGKPAFDLP